MKRKARSVVRRKRASSHSSKHSAKTYAGSKLTAYGAKSKARSLRRRKHRQKGGRGRVHTRRRRYGGMFAEIFGKRDKDNDDETNAESKLYEYLRLVEYYKIKPSDIDWDKYIKKITDQTLKKEFEDRKEAGLSKIPTIVTENCTNKPNSTSIQSTTDALNKNIIKEGHIQKHAENMTASNKWNNRYMILYKDRLEYKNDMNDSSPKQTLNFRDKDINVEKKSNDTNTFIIKFKGTLVSDFLNFPKKWTFQTNWRDERDDWVSKIMKAINSTKEEETKKNMQGVNTVLADFGEDFVL